MFALVTSSLVGMRLGLMLLAASVLLVWWNTPPAPTLGRRLIARGIGLLVVATLVLQPVRLGWLMTRSMSRFASRLVDLAGVTAFAAGLICCLAGVALLQGVGRARVLRGVAANIAACWGFVLLAWAFHR